MKKNILVAMGIALVLFIYGYLASSAGIDHSSHNHGNTQVEEGHLDQGHDHQH